MIRILILTALIFISSQVRAEEACPKTVSIGGAITEIVYKLGKEQCLVGADTTSTYPPQAKELPMVGYQRQLSAEGILSLNPDIILHTNQAGPRAVLKQIDQAGIKRIVVDDTPNLEGVFSKIHSVAQAFDVQELGETLITELKSQSQSLPSNSAVKPKALFIMQHGSGAPMVGGKDTAADAIITMAGGRNVIEFIQYKPLTPEAMASLNPDIIVTTEGSLKQMGGIEGMLQTPGIKLTKAGQDKNIVAMDALLILGFGPRTVEAAQQLSKEFQKEI